MVAERDEDEASTVIGTGERSTDSHRPSSPPGACAHMRRQQRTRPPASPQRRSSPAVPPATRAVEAAGGSAASAAVDWLRSGRRDPYGSGTGAFDLEAALAVAATETAGQDGAGGPLPAASAWRTSSWAVWRAWASVRPRSWPLERARSTTVTTTRLPTRTQCHPTSYLSHRAFFISGGQTASDLGGAGHGGLVGAGDGSASVLHRMLILRSVTWAIGYSPSR